MSNRNILFWGVGVIIVAVLALWLWNANWSSAPSAMATSTATTTTTSQVVYHQSSSDVATIASSISGASTFASLFASTGVKSEVTGKGPYTIFVPTDGAISLLPQGSIQNLSAAEKKRFVEYHIVSGRALDIGVMTAGTIEAMSRDMLNFTIADDKTPRVNSSFIIEAYHGSNGVVYLINGALFPPQAQ